MAISDLRRYAVAIGLCVLPFLAAPAPAYSEVLIAPFPDVGTLNNVFPFGEIPCGRYEEIWNSSLFGALGGQPALLTELDFFTTQGAGSQAFPGDTLSIGTTTVCQADIHCGGNMGANASNGETLVASCYTLTDIGGSFNSQLIFTTPFLYNPALGNLLIDFQGASDHHFCTCTQGGRKGAGRAGADDFASANDVEVTQFVFTPEASGAPEIDGQNAAIPVAFTLGVLCLAVDTRRRFVRRSS